MSLFTNTEKTLAVEYYSSAIDRIETLVEIAEKELMNPFKYQYMAKEDLKDVLSALHSMEAIIAVPLNLDY